MPSRSTLVRGGGLAAFLAGVMYILGPISMALDYPSASTFTGLHLSTVWGVPLRLLMLFGLVGLHARQAGSPRYGRLGTAGFLLALVGNLLAVALGPLAFSGFSDGASSSFVGLVVTGAMAVAAELGLLLLGMATLRAAVLPLPWGALPLGLFLVDVLLTLLAALGSLLLPAGTGVLALIYAQPLLLGVVWALLGYALWSEIGEGARDRRTRTV